MDKPRKRLKKNSEFAATQSEPICVLNDENEKADAIMKSKMNCDEDNYGHNYT